MDLDIDAAVKFLDENAKPAPTFHCAAYVRKALEAGGLDMTDRPISAKDYGPYLSRLGFTSVAQEMYLPQAGDVVVIQNYNGGDVHGHIAMYDGRQWVSDFKQQDMWGGPGYRTKKPPYMVYRP